MTSGKSWLKKLWQNALKLIGKASSDNILSGTEPALIMTDRSYKVKHRSEIRSPNRLSQKGKRRRARQRKSTKR